MGVFFDFWLYGEKVCDNKNSVIEIQHFVVILPVKSNSAYIRK